MPAYTIPIFPSVLVLFVEGKRTSFLTRDFDLTHQEKQNVLHDPLETALGGMKGEGGSFDPCSVKVGSQ